MNAALPNTMKKQLNQRQIEALRGIAATGSTDITLVKSVPALLRRELVKYAPRTDGRGYWMVPTEAGQAILANVT